MEGAGLAAFMISACLLGTLIENPASPVRQAIGDPVSRRVLMGLGMGLTAIALIYSPWGKQSGAHLNPSVTLAFFRLRKIKPWDALFYMTAQFFGGAFGVLTAAAMLGDLIAHPSVNYVATLPGPYGLGAAFVAEMTISFILMTVVLAASNNPGLHRFTGILAGALVAAYIAFEAPISGMSMNPARTFGSALSAQVWEAIWLYFTAPVLGMLLAAQVYRWQKGRQGVVCAKLHHENDKRCIFCGQSRIFLLPST